MKNFWLLRKPRICQQINPYADFYGKWYVIKRSYTQNSDVYLHRDGVWRVTTYNVLIGKHTGYFNTEQDAINTLEMVRIS
jgi:hypothetical protein